MSSDQKPSFRAAFKNKINKAFKSNITSSIRERIISNDTYHHLRDKSRNLTDIVIERTHLDKVINKTKAFIPGISSSKDNQTLSKGFYDSIFSPQSENDVYLKVAVMCFWIIAIICIIPTIITIFIPVRKNKIGTTGVKMIFFHIFLCELFYLIYILLSMINVAQHYQLNSYICDFANYGMYITIPVMYFALFFLSIERITKRCKADNGWTKIFTNAWLTQLILIVIWVLLIAAIVTIMLIKKQFSTMNVLKRAKSLIPSNLAGAIQSAMPAYRCTIDGRLSPVFKILFIVLFVVLIILIIKALAVPILCKLGTSGCCRGDSNENQDKKQANQHITLLFGIFLFLNLFLSFPFYAVSMTDSIFRTFISQKDTFTMTLKICFVLRLISIVLQCLTYYTFESKSWYFLRMLIYNVTCKKCPVLIDGGSGSEKERDSASSGKSSRSEAGKKPVTTPSSSKIQRATSKQSHKPVPQKPSTSSSSDDAIDDNSDNEKKPVIRKQPSRTNHSNDKTTIGKIVNKSIGDDNEFTRMSADSSDNEDNNEVFYSEPVTELLVTKKSAKTRTYESDQIDSDDEVQKKSKSSTSKKESTTNSRHKKSETKDEKIPLKTQPSTHSNTNGSSKKLPNGNGISKHHSDQSSSSSSSDTSDNNSDDDKIEPIRSSSTNGRKHNNKHSPDQQRHRTNPTTKNGKIRKSSKHTRKPKQDRLKKILDSSVEV